MNGGFCGPMALVGTLLMAATSVAAERFILEVPGSPDAHSTAIRAARTLEIVDAAGHRFVYLRRPDLDGDTPAGRFHGYHSREADRYIGWPADGSGPMLLGTWAGGGRIDWRRSRMVVRPAAVWPHVVVVAERPALVSRRLLSRTVQPRAPLAPATVTLQNSHHEELIVRIADARQPGQLVEVAVPPGGAVERPFDRDAGAEVVEVYLAPGPAGTLVREEVRRAVAPRQIYSLAVYANRVTSTYTDRRPNKPAGALPDSETRTAVSLGVLPVPPNLPAAATLDVYQAARSRNNPGAAAWFGSR